MKNHYKNLLSACVISALALTSCTDDVVDPTTDTSTTVIPETITKPIETVMIGGQLFSIPSPIQTALLIKGTGAEFDETYLNPKSNLDNYTTRFQKATNLGVYGADLGYSSIYQNEPISLKYLGAVRKLSEKVGVENAFNESLIERFSMNSSNEDSMMVYISEAYRSADNYLKSNDKDDDAALILAGGWIESMYFSCKTASEGNQEVITRLGEQKRTIKSMIDLLATIELTGDEDFEDFKEGLEDLFEVFHEVSSSYEFIEPTTDPENRLTTINSKNTISISDETMTKIVAGLSDLRKLITG